MLVIIYDDSQTVYTSPEDMIYWCSYIWNIWSDVIRSIELSKFVVVHFRGYLPIWSYPWEKIKSGVNGVLYGK